MNLWSDIGVVRHRSACNVLIIQKLKGGIGVQGGWGGGVQPPRIFQVTIFGQKYNIRAKPLHFGASAGGDIRAKDLRSPPPPNKTGPERLYERRTR